MQNLLKDGLPATGYIRQSHLIPAILPFSSATLWRKVKAGDFPRPVKLSERVTAWKIEDIRAWMQSRTTAWKNASSCSRTDTDVDVSSNSNTPN